MIPYFILGLAFLVAAIFFGRWFANANPKDVLKVLRWALIVAGAAFGLLLLIFGRNLLLPLLMAVIGLFLFRGGQVWNRIKADVMGLPYVALEREDLAALGDAIIAGCALGIYDDMAATAEQLGQRGRRFEPSKENHRRYETCTAYYADMLRHLAPAYDALAALGEGK